MSDTSSAPSSGIRLIGFLLTIAPSSARAEAPFFVSGIFWLWLMANVAIPFVALVIPGTTGERLLRLLGFSLLGIIAAIGGAALAISVMVPGLSESIALLVTASVYGVIVYLYRVNSEHSGQANVSEQLIQSAALNDGNRHSYLKLAKGLKSVGMPRDQVVSALTSRGLQLADANTIVGEAFSG